MMQANDTPSVNLNELRLDKYVGLLQKTTGEELGFALCNRHGDPEWIGDSSQRENIERAIKQANGANGGWYYQGFELGQQHRVLPGGEVFVFQALGTKLTGVIGYLVTLAEAPDEESHPGLILRVKSVLKDIGACVEAEYLLTEELNHMADELAGRYEELNLVYSFEEQIKEYNPKHGVAVIQQLLSDCVDYLTVDAVILVLPNDGIREVCIAQTSKHELGNWDELLRGIQTEFLPKEIATHTSIVINEPNPAENSLYHNKLRLKLAVAPILDLKREFRGMLAIAVRPNKPDISNSDRKMVEVLAKQISILVQSNYDILTGMLNRQGFDTRAQSLLSTLTASEGEHTLLLVNMDQFKVVNDICGHLAGDELLKQISGIITAKTRDSDVAARLGNDEFAVLLSNCPLKTGLAVAYKLSQSIREHRFSWQTKVLDISASIGVVSLSSGGGEISNYLGSATSACLAAKTTGLGKVYQYQADDKACITHTGQMEWVPRLQNALKTNSFKLFGQQIATVDGRDPLPRWEILLRLEDKDGLLVSAFDFIPSAERFQLMTQIDRWVIHNAITTLSIALEGRETTPVSCSINLSGQSLTEEGFLEYIIAEHRASAIPADSICFEITETAAIASFSAARHLMGKLRDYGFRFSLDDFGSGLSSFSYLNNLPVDYLKIDGSLVKEIATDPVRATMVESISRIGQAMKIKTVAEYVENNEILSVLQAIGVDYAQGYSIGKPMPLQELMHSLLSVAKDIVAD